MRVHGQRREQPVQLREPHAAHGARGAVRAVGVRGGGVGRPEGSPQTAVEVLRAVLALLANPTDAGWGWRWMAIKIGLSVWVRQFFTLAVSRDLYAGVPAVYVNYVDYDVAAHLFGPRSRRALRALSRVDAGIRQIWRVNRRVPEHRYAFYVLSDHGQAECRSALDITGGRRFERWVFEEMIDPRPVPPAKRAVGPDGGDPGPPPRNGRLLPALPQLSRRGVPGAATPKRISATASA